MHYVLIRGASYRGLAFHDREKIRDSLREQLEARGVRFVQYDWVWDEKDRCLLVVGTYESLEQAIWWIRALESMGFEICVRTGLPGKAAGGS